MIIFTLNLFLLTIKILVYSSLTSDKVFLKFVLIIFLGIFIYILYTYPKPVKDNLDIITDYYKIHNTVDKIFTFFIIFLYISIFFGGILYLRFLNIGKILDLKILGKKIYSTILEHDLAVNILNILLIFLIIIVYVVLLLKITKYFKRYFIKIHLFYNHYDDTWYHDYFLNHFCFEYNYRHLTNGLALKYFILFQKKIVGFSLEYHFVMLAKSFHYIFLIVILFYDIIFNNWILYYTYTIFPFIFIYHTYIKACNTYYNLDILYGADPVLREYMYSNDIKVISKEEVRIGRYYMHPKDLAEFVFVYLKYGLNGYLLDLIKDNNYKNSYKYNYYKD